MSDISLLARLLNGVTRNVDISANTLVTTSIKVGGGISNTELTKAILDNLVNLQNGTDFSNGTNSHTHDGRYFTKTQLQNSGSGTAGSNDIGDDNSYSNFTPSTATVKGALSAIDTALASSVTPLDGTFRIENSSDNTKKIAFSASAISTATTRTISMPDADVNLADVNNAILKDGSRAFTANQPMGGFKLTGLAAGSGAGDSVRYQQAILTSGANAFAANQPMGGFKLTGLGAGSTAGDSVRYEQAILTSGANAFAANQSMGGNKLTSLAAATANGDAVRYEQAVLTDGSHAITGDLSFSGTAKITNLVDPVSAQDGATKAYVDNTLAGLSWKEAVLAASTANLNLSSMPASVDGVTLSSGDRFLAKDQTSGAQNGIYIFNGAASAATRSTDADSWNEIVGLVVYVVEGSTNSGSKWNTTNAPGGTLGTTAITFTVFAAASALDGVGTAGYNAYWTASHTLAAEQYVAASRGGLATDASAFTGVVKASSGVFSASTIVNADVSATAAIAYSKLNLSGSIVNADINSSAAIAYSKLNLSASIVNADIASGAAIAYSKLALSNSIVLGDLTSNSVDENKIVSTSFSASGAVAGGSGSKIAVQVDGSSIEISSNALRVKSTAYDQVTITGGSGSAAAVQQAPLVQKVLVAGEAFAANTSFAVRWGMNSLTETADRVYKADYDTTSADKFWVIGIAYSTSSVSAGQNINVVLLGSYTLQSSDSSFATGDIGKPVWLTSSGAFSTTAPSTSLQASFKLGIVESTTKMWVDRQMMGVN